MKKILQIVMVVLAVPISALYAQVSEVLVEPEYKIVIDPGHGGTDPGAEGNGLQEKVVNLELGLMLRTWLQRDAADHNGGGNWKVYMTRSTDTTVSLSSRTAYANSIGADRFVSLHANAYHLSSANGTETFCYTSGSSNSFALRNLIQEEMILAWGLTDRGTKTGNFYVLRETVMPATLSETGFITNSNDATYIGSGYWQDVMARRHMYALQRHYGYSRYWP